MSIVVKFANNKRLKKKLNRKKLYANYVRRSERFSLLLFKFDMFT